VFIHGERFEIVRLPDLNVAASPDVRIIVDDDRIYTVGGVGIPLADIDIQTVPTTAHRPSRDAVVYGREDRNRGSRKTVMDVNVTLGDDVHLSGFGLETDLTGSLRIQRTPQTPLTGNGRISLQDGRFEAYGQDLEVENGELFFSGPLDNPLFDVRAVRKLPEVTAGIHVTGNPGRLSSELFSDPDMSEAEALSYLLTGRPLNIADSGDGDLLNQAAFALGMSQAGAITSQVRSSLGLETLTVEGGLDDSRIIAGKRIGGRLLVEYGYGLVDQLGTLILKYQVNERLTLESSTGSVSTVDLIYNVRRK
jgi:translocation and assembly module TamB